jgi:D-aminopeptidase
MNICIKVIENNISNIKVSAHTRPINNTKVYEHTINNIKVSEHTINNIKVSEHTINVCGNHSTL